MKYLLILLLFGCKETDYQSTCDQIEGVWRSEKGTHIFTDGYLEQSIQFVETVYESEFSYTCKKDTVFFVNLKTDFRYRSTVSFPTDSTLILKDVGGLQKTLKRVR